MIISGKALILRAINYFMMLIFARNAKGRITVRGPNAVHREIQSFQQITTHETKLQIIFDVLYTVKYSVTQHY